MVPLSLLHAIEEQDTQGRIEIIIYLTGKIKEDEVNNFIVRTYFFITASFLNTMKLIVVSLESIRAIFYPASPRGYDSEWLYLFFECQTVTPEHPFKKIEEKMEEVWRLKFKGIDEKLSGSTVAATLDPLVKTAPGQSKRKAAKVAAAASTSIVSDGPKSAEVIWKPRSQSRARRSAG